VVDGGRGGSHILSYLTYPKKWLVPPHLKILATPLLHMATRSHVIDICCFTILKHHLLLSHFLCFTYIHLFVVFRIYLSVVDDEMCCHTINKQLPGRVSRTCYKFRGRSILGQCPVKRTWYVADQRSSFVDEGGASVKMEGIWHTLNYLCCGSRLRVDRQYNRGQRAGEYIICTIT
jgi:hypothetical protein